jgi:glycosyltransferase involved in cell wall biosynthesis
MRASQPRRIVLVGPLPPPSGGMANQTRQLAALLATHDCAVVLVRNNEPYRPAWIVGVRGVRAFARLVPYLWRLWRAMDDAELVHVMANSGWAWHLLAAPAVWIATWRGVPAIVNYRGGEAEAFLARQIAWVRPTLARARAIVVPSAFLAGVFGRHGIETTIVPNIVDLEAFRPAAALPSDPHLLVTRNLEPIYDIPTALRAFALVAARHPRASLTIAGSGPERAALEALAAQLGVAASVRFTGRLDNSALPALYRTASVVLNASTVDNMPISLLEAMASGIPVVSTNVGGVPFMVEHDRTALLVPAGQPEAMARATLAILEDAAVAARLRAAGLAQAARYAWPNVAPRLFEAYARACTTGAARAHA